MEAKRAWRAVEGMALVGGVGSVKDRLGTGGEEGGDG